ncbi:DUF3800 domain-containing protein [Clostridium sp.]|uniref:DUF3800 domain-containing protein n=1 Tax=Clostridium sp. TaxID=1506 RepID=UPI002FCBE1BF
MSFNIYFDESHKIDKYTSNFAYYGIMGLKGDRIKEINDYIRENNLYKEMHFSNFKLDKIDEYIDVVLYLLNIAKFNIYIVNTDEAFKMDINEEELRKRFYIKIPERLIYGMTRHMDAYEEINIFIDKSDDYGSYSDSCLIDCEINNILKRIKGSNEDIHKKINLLETKLNNRFNKVDICKIIKEQLNSQALYRGLKYKVKKVEQKDSKKDKCLQVIDVILGCIVFLFEENYYDIQHNISIAQYNDIIENADLTSEEKEFISQIFKLNKDSTGYIYTVKQDELEIKYRVKQLNKKLRLHSQASIQKSEFIYKILSNPRYLDIFEKFNIYIWGEDQINKSYSNCRKVVNKFNLSKYIAKFLDFKYKFDNERRLEILDIYLKKGKELRYTESDYKDEIGYGTGLKRLLRRYINELKIEIHEA